MNNIISEIGKDYIGRPILAIDASKFRILPDYDSIFKHIHTFLYKYANRDFVLAYFHQGLSYWNRPSLKKMSEFYNTVDHGIGKSMKLLLIVHPPVYYQLLFSLMKPFLNQKVLFKIILIPSLCDLYSYFDTSSVNMPEIIFNSKINNFQQEWPITANDNELNHVWFGTTLRELSERKLLKNGIPKLLLKYIDYIEQHGLSTVGIMRVCPRNNDFVAHLDKLDEQCSVDIPSVSIACSVVKKFFSSLKEPIFPCYIWKSLKNFRGLSVDEQKDIISHDLQFIPPINLACIECLANLIDKISANSSINQMSYNNLAICLAPSLLWPPTSGALTDNLVEVNNLTQYITIYFENHKKLSRIFS